MLGIHQNINRKGNRLLLLVVRLVEQEIRCQLLVLVAGKVRLDHGIPREAQTAELWIVSGWARGSSAALDLHARWHPVPPL